MIRRWFYICATALLAGILIAAAELHHFIADRELAVDDARLGAWGDDWRAARDGIGRT